MIRIKNISAKKYITYDNLDFDIPEGLFTVRGKNRSGKSLIFSALGSVIYHAPPLLSKKNSAKIMHEQGSSINITIEDEDNPWNICQKFDKNFSYEIWKNGKNLGVKSVGKAKQFIKEIFPISEELFYSSVYLNAFKSSILQHSTPTARLKFFEDMFDMDVLQKLYRISQGEYSSIKNNLKTLVGTEQKLSLNKERLVDEQFIKNSIKNFRKIIAISEKNLASYRHQYSILNSFIIISDSVVNAKPEEIEEKILLVKRQIKKARVHQKKYDLYIENRDKLDKINNILSKLPQKTSIQIKMKIATLKSMNKKHLTWLDKRAEIVLIKGVKPKKLIEPIGNKINKTLGRIEYCKSVIDSLNSVGSNCPSCKQSVTDEYKEKMLKIINSELQNQTDHLKELEMSVKQDEQFHQKRKLRQLKKKYKKYLRVDVNRNLDIIEGLKLDLRKAKLATKLNRTKKKLKIRKVHENKYDEKTLQFKLESYIKEKSVAESREKFEKDIGEVENISTETAKNLVKSMKVKIPFYEKTIAILRDKISKLESDLAVNNVIYGQIHELEKEIEKLREVTKDADVYESLLYAFSSKGIRSVFLKSIAENYKYLLNENAQLLFGEPFEFFVDINSGKLDIMAQRSGKISDVALLSGSESRCFPLLSLYSLIQMIPSNNRCSLVVLDEMETGLDEYSKNLFIQEYLPKLNELVPSICLITPQNSSALTVEGKTFTVTKVGGKSFVTGD
jgi:DNA repair exonuclease SbcCD ATPase subunit